MDKELRGVLKLGARTLVIQETRLYRLKQASAPGILTDEISRSIEETKREIIRLTKIMGYRERASTLRKMIQQAVDEEIDRAIELRKNRCLRCIHGRFYDRSGTAFENLPAVSSLVKSIGCDQLRPNLRKTCRRFMETTIAHSLEDYLDEMNFLYEFREWVDRIEEIWQDYFLK